jgi:hypothetical protein
MLHARCGQNWHGLESIRRDACGKNLASRGHPPTTPSASPTQKRRPPPASAEGGVRLKKAGEAIRTRDIHVGDVRGNRPRGAGRVSPILTPLSCRMTGWTRWSGRGLSSRTSSGQRFSVWSTERVSGDLGGGGDVDRECIPKRARQVSKVNICGHMSPNDESGIRSEMLKDVSSRLADMLVVIDNLCEFRFSSWRPGLIASFLAGLFQRIPDTCTGLTGSV